MDTDSCSNSESVGGATAPCVCVGRTNSVKLLLFSCSRARRNNRIPQEERDLSVHTNYSPLWFRVHMCHPHALLCRFLLNSCSASNQPIDQPGDTSNGLEIAGTDALQLNGANIQRVSTSPSQLADLTINGGGTSGLSQLSLRGGGDDADVSTSAADLLPVVLDCSDTPVVLGVMATAFAGEYGAGQRIYFQVRQLSRKKSKGLLYLIHNMPRSSPFVPSVVLAIGVMTCRRHHRLSSESAPRRCIQTLQVVRVSFMSTSVRPEVERILESSRRKITIMPPSLLKL